ncbi:hypothetical protein ACFQ9X_45600 [Catenulispora yoronensis]
MSMPSVTPITRFDYRVRIAATLLRAAPRREHLVVGGMVVTSAAAAWPLGGALVMVPALLALAALIRHHLDGLDARREALAAAGARRADTAVIQAAGPLCATGLGALVGIVGSAALGRTGTQALAPVVMGIVAALVVRRSWFGAPALGAACLAALVTAAVPLVAATPSSPPSGLPSGRQGARLAQAPADAWSGLWSTVLPTVLAAVLVLAAVQAAIVHRERLRRLGRRVAAAPGAA